jgi:hypothetical protein
MKLESIYFITAMFVTIFILYVFAPQPEVMVKYPDISKKVSDVYVDDQGVCYRYHRVEVPTDKSNVTSTLVPVKVKCDTQ